MALAAHGTSHVVVRQIKRNFDRSEVSLNVGEIIRFTNEDEFLHQIYVESKDFSFDSDEKGPGEELDVEFPVPGHFTVRCGIHPRMGLDVSVEK
nr:methylamine utilization protein [Jiella mangrovi]